MEQKNRGRTVLCAASQCFHTLLKLPLPGQFVFSFSSFSLPICSFLPSAAGRLRRHGLDGDFDRRLAKFWRRRRRIKLGMEGGYCPKATAHGQNVCVTLSKQE